MAEMILNISGNPYIKPAQKAGVKKMDGNKDGKVSETEYKAAHPNVPDEYLISFEDFVSSVTTRPIIEVNGKNIRVDQLAGLKKFAADNKLSLDVVVARMQTSASGYVTHLALGRNKNVRNLSALAVLDRLEVLTVFQTSIYDIAPLAKCSRLRKLSIGGTNVVDLSPLAKLTQLEVLYLWGCKKIRDFSPLAKLTKLDELWAPWAFGDKDLVYLDKMTRLCHLSLKDSSVTDKYGYYLKRMDRSKRFIPLDWRYMRMSAAERAKRPIKPAERKALEDLIQANNHIGLDPERVFSGALIDKQGHIVGLNLHGDADSQGRVTRSESVQDISALSRLPHLRVLRLYATKIDNAQLAHLSGLTQLRELSLGGTNITDIKPLSRLINLEILYLWGTKVSNIKPVARFRKLDEIFLDGTLVRDISPLRRLPRLRQVNLPAGVSPKGLKPGVIYQDLR